MRASGPAVVLTCQSMANVQARKKDARQRRVASTPRDEARAGKRAFEQESALLRQSLRRYQAAGARPISARPRWGGGLEPVGPHEHDLGQRDQRGEGRAVLGCRKEDADTEGLLALDDDELAVAGGDGDVTQARHIPGSRPALEDV